jgi:hypothetical protein
MQATWPELASTLLGLIGLGHPSGKVTECYMQQREPVHNKKTSSQVSNTTAAHLDANVLHAVAGVIGKQANGQQTV